MGPLKGTFYLPPKPRQPKTKNYKLKCFFVRLNHVILSEGHKYLLRLDSCLLLLSQTVTPKNITYLLTYPPCHNFSRNNNNYGNLRESYHLPTIARVVCIRPADF